MPGQAAESHEGVGGHEAVGDGHYLPDVCRDSMNRWPQHRSQYTMVLVLRTPEKSPYLLETPILSGTHQLYTHLTSLEAHRKLYSPNHSQNPGSHKSTVSTPASGFIGFPVMEEHDLAGRKVGSGFEI